MGFFCSCFMLKKIKSNSFSSWGRWMICGFWWSPFVFCVTSCFYVTLKYEYVFLLKCVNLLAGYRNGNFSLQWKQSRDHPSLLIYVCIQAVLYYRGHSRITDLTWLNVTLRWICFLLMFCFCFFVLLKEKILFALRSPLQMQHFKSTPGPFTSVAASLCNRISWIGINISNHQIGLPQWNLCKIFTF